jgi:hypothetical protein
MLSMGQQYTHFTPEKRVAFLAHIAAGGTVTAAARSIAMSRRNAYFVRDADPEFAAAWDDAWEEGTERLEQVAIERGMEKSDVLLIFMLKGRKPDTYRDNASVKLSGDPDAPIVTQQKADPDALRAAELAYLAARPQGS